MLRESGVVDVVIGEPVDMCGGAEGEERALAFEVYSYLFLAHRPPANRRP